MEYLCTNEFVQCEADPACVQTLQCSYKCWSLWETDPSPQKYSVQNCTNVCVATYGNENLLKYLHCIDVNNCLELPIIQSTCKAPKNITFAKDIKLKDLTGTWLTLSGYNPVYDCYPCQENTITSSTFLGKFQAILENGTLKEMNQLGSITDLSPNPGFNMTVETAGFVLRTTFWPFDHISTFLGNSYYLIYYCGSANLWNYEGALVYSKSSKISDSDLTNIRNSFMNNVSLNFDKFCSPSTTNCPK